ncbi:MAG: hypothetical protein ACHQ16_00355 [Candidatus Lutacidiplasmatales archaeon]
MIARVVLLAAILIGLGVSLISAPIDEGSVTSTVVASGLWQDVALPTSVSWTGSPATLELSWGTIPLRCAAYWVDCRGYSPPPASHLAVFDCGASPCEPGRNYSLVLTTGAAVGGNVAVNATPGEHFQVWAFSGQFAPSNTTIPLRYAVDGPVFDGVLGAAMAGLGIEAAVMAGLLWRADRRRAKVLDSRF